MNITVFRVYQLNLLTAISMYMKSLFYLFLSIVGAWLFSSCSDDFLGETETTDLDQATVFADSTYTADFLNQIYVDIGFDIQHNRYKDQYNDHGGLQTSCDEAAYKASTGLTTDVMFATGTVNPVTISEDDVWRIAYRNIRRVNVFFKYADGSRMAEVAKEEYKAEARFLRAWYYAMLLRHYGGVALIGDDVYETVEEADHTLPLLIPMSEVAGRMSIQEGARFLEKPQGGKGILLGGVPGVKPAKVLILGGGVVGSNAAQMAAGMGADVTITDINLARLRYLSETLPKNVKTLYASELRIRKELPDVDLVVGSVLIPGDKAPHLITKEMLSMMQPGTVLVDVAIDQGGCFETSHPTTHSAPTYIVDGIVHYAVANIPGAVPYTSTLALTNATLPYVIALANKGWKKACKDNPALALGLNIVEGKIVYKAVADVFGLKYDPINL